MLNVTVQDTLNEQIKNEFFASYLYLAMSAYYEAINLPGFAYWMRAQAEEEREHAMKIYAFIYARGGRVVLQAIDQPPTEFDSPLAAFQAALAHEQHVSQQINELYGLAIREDDYPTQVMLQWFITEQVEEEKSVGDIVDQLKIIGDHPTALFMMDRQLGAGSGR